MSRRPSFLTGVVLLLPSLSSTAAEPFRFPEARHANGSLTYINGVPVLQVAGSPEEIGAAVGALAVKPGMRMVGYPKDILKEYHLTPLWRLFVNAGVKMAESFPEDYKRELDAMARGSGVDRESLVVGNTLFDLKKVIACSALLIEPKRSATGGPLLARNLDYPSLGYAHEYSLVTLYRPEGANHAFATIGFPGLLGCLSGINDAGLTVAVLEVFQLRPDRKWFSSSGTPYALCYRRVLEECATIAEARVCLEKMKRTTASNLVVADRQGIAVFEVTPEYVVLRRAEQGTCVCTNHFCSEPLRPAAGLNLFDTYSRFQRLESAARKQSRLEIEDLHRSLDSVRFTKETMQTMIFEPATLRLHLAIGACPSSTEPLHRLELQPLLQKQ